MWMNNVYVYPELTFKNRKQAESYMRLVRNVKAVLPIAKQARQMLIETTEYLETLPTKEEKDALPIVIRLPSVRRIWSPGSMS